MTGNAPSAKTGFDKLDAVQETRDVAVTAAVLHALKSSGVQLTDQQLAAAYKAAEDFAATDAGKGFTTSAHAAIPAPVTKP